MNARLIPGPGDAPLPTVPSTLANELRDQVYAIREAAEAIGNARADIPIVSDICRDSRRREIVDQIIQLESALHDLADDIISIVED